MNHCERGWYIGLALSVVVGMACLIPTYAAAQTDVDATIEQFVPNMFLVNADVVVSEPSDETKNNRLCRNVGAAFSFGSDGYLVTLDCVVRDAKQITVKSHEGYSLPAQLIGTSEANRISVLKTDKTVVHMLPTGYLGGVAEPGSDVLLLCRDNDTVHQHTGTVGLVRPPDGTFVVEASAPNAVSGSPVFTTDGHLLGLLALQIERTDIAGDSPMTFGEKSEDVSSFVVIPTEYVWVVAQSMINSHDGTCGWLGVSSDIITPEGPAGVLVRSVVENSPAAISGLRIDDRITAFNGAEVPTFRHLIEQLSVTSVGETVELTYHRGAQTATVAVTLAPYPALKH